MINRYRAQSRFDNGKPFICGGTKRAPVNDRLAALNADGDPRTGCVVGNDHLTRDAAPNATPPHEGTHFDTAGLRTLGQRYGTKYLEMTDDEPDDTNLKI